MSGLAAGRLWRFDNFDRDWVEFTGPPHLRGRKGPFELHTTDYLPLIDRAHAQRFPVTSPARTIVDLAARNGSRRLLGNAIETSMRLGLTSEPFLRARLQALRGSGRAGVRVLDVVLRNAGGHSELEREFLRLMNENGLPKPSCQVTHTKDGKTIARVDFQFDPWRLVVEVNGRLGHVTDEDRDNDARRNNELVSEGFVVITFVTKAVMESPDYVVEAVRRQLRLLGASV